MNNKSIWRLVFWKTSNFRKIFKLARSSLWRRTSLRRFKKNVVFLRWGSWLKTSRISKRVLISTISWRISCQPTKSILSIKSSSRMAIYGQKNQPTTFKIHHWHFNSHLMSFQNTSKTVTLTFNSNSTLVFLFSKEISTMERSKISSLKICTFWFCFSSTKKRRCCLVIWKRRLRLLV